MPAPGSRGKRLDRPDIRTKRVYDPSDEGDGARVLIMRLWPRGIRKDRVTVWLRELGPVVSLLREFRARGVPWPAYRERYLAGLERPEAQAHVAQVLELSAQGPVTLLCGCPDEAHCHRSLLKAYLVGRVL